MGGLGKTTLAKKVYYSDEVKQHFEVHAWVSVSQDYQVPALLKEIIKEVTGMKSENSSEEELKRELFHALNRRRYLVVLDDVWKTEVWRRIETTFPDAGSGSRVIFTTRRRDVAFAADPSPYEPSVLGETDSTILFLRKVYLRKYVGRFERDLEDVGQKLVRQCGGLPLALVLLRGLLSTKEKNLSVWSRVLTALNNLNWQTSEEGKQCIQILGLSYDELPYQLKPCFLYIGCFPEDELINAARLIRLWIAEGFVPQVQGETATETAESFMEELLQRCLIQVVNRKYNGIVRRIRIHDLLRDLCIEEARESTFLDVGSPLHNSLSASASASARPSVKATRRLAIYNSLGSEYMGFSRTYLMTPKLRTLLCFTLEHEIGRSINRLSLIRVIDVNCNTADIPKEIGGMRYLRYLKWKVAITSNVVKFQSSLHNLCNLQTLDMHPAINGNVEGLDALKNLQVLKHIRLGPWLEDELSKLTNLEKLYIREFKASSHEKTQLEALQNLLHLRVLSLRAKPGGDVPTEILGMFANQQNLRELKLLGRLSDRERLPESSSFPPNLTKLILDMSRLEEDPMPVLEKLPNLLLLRLNDHAYKGKSLHCSAGGFPRLQHMRLEFLPHWQDWKMDVGTMPSLTHLSIHGCWNLKKLPDDLCNITSLKEIQLTAMSGDLSRRVKNESGEDRYKIQHIPSILFEQSIL